MPSSYVPERTINPTNGTFDFDFVRSGLRVAGVIVHETDGGSIRTISGRGMTRPNGRFPSVKTRRTQPFDAMLQRAEMHNCEADPTVTDYLAEPHRVEIHSPMGKLTYFPDLMRVRSNGDVEVLEIKKSLDEVSRDPRYQYKLDCARSIYEWQGWSFQILAAEDIEGEPRRSNAASIALDRSTHVSTAQRMTIANAIADNGGVLDMGEAIAVLGESGSYDCNAGRARLNALIVHRFVEVDIGRRLNIHSPVRMVTTPTPPTIAEMVSALRRPVGIDDMEVA
jgi:hypothetical protein